jgi:competence protein ComGC
LTVVNNTKKKLSKLIKITLVSFSLIILIIAVLIFRPVPIVSESNAISEIGIVKEIYSNKGNDVIFVMENTDRRFYINRGLENGLELNNLKEKLIGNSIVVKYPKYWTPLDWNDKIKHISKVEFNNEILFNELKGE